MLTSVALLALLVWAYLIFLHHGFWRGDQRLPPTLPPPPAWPSVTAIVPARNEAETIARVVTALTTQDYLGALRVIVVDDASTDGTATLARNAGMPAHQLDVITAPPLAAGWTGKLWALNTGLMHIAREPSDYVWFTDADVVHPPGTLAHLVSKAVGDRRDLVSLMVRLRCESFWERYLIPAFIFFFQMLYPFRAANDDRSRVAAAAGGCVLLRHEALVKAGGLVSIRGRIIDDCALAAAVKGAGGRIWLGLADASRSLRRADHLAPLWGMVRRTAFTQLKHSNLLLLLTLFGLTLVFLVPPAMVLSFPWHGHGLAALAGVLAWGGMTYAYGPTLRDYGRSPWEALILPGAALLYAGMTLDSGVAHWRQRGGQWKGRHYGPSSNPENLSESP